MKKLDGVGWYIVNLHQILGHAKAAATLGQPSGDTEQCVVCRYERGHATRDEVINALGVNR
jgi:hypothetical protein